MLVTLLSPKGKSLRQPCEPVTDFETQVEPYLPEAEKVMKEKDGIGLAAPQIGINYSWFINGESQLFVNPEIIEKDKPISVVEGCLSLPRRWYEVPRYAMVKVQCYDDDFKPWQFEYVGLDALVMQHEIDHLNGVLICDIGRRVYE